MIDMEKIGFCETPVGKICIGEENGKITRVTWSNLPQEYIPEETDLILRCKKQLEEYFSGKRQVFDLPLAPKGTAFQKRVWKALSDIPYGETRAYGEIAAAIGNPKAARAVGMANHKNPVGILIPCHRVVGAKGDLVGYAAGTEIKKFLLELEKKQKNTC